jgi:hypothetical protein
MREMGYSYNILVGELEGKRYLGIDGRIILTLILTKHGMKMSNREDVDLKQEKLFAVSVLLSCVSNPLCYASMSDGSNNLACNLLSPTCLTQKYRIGSPNNTKSVCGQYRTLEYTVHGPPCWFRSLCFAVARESLADVVIHWPCNC